MKLDFKEKFTANSYNYRLVDKITVKEYYIDSEEKERYRVIYYAIYQQTKNGKTYAYELQKMRRLKKDKISKKGYAWRHPSQSEWGTYGWTLGSHDDALVWLGVDKEVLDDRRIWN